MKRGSTKKESSLSIAIVVAIVLIASTILILRPNPEQVIAISQDRLVRLEGVTRSPGGVLIERLDGVETSIPELASPIYELFMENHGTLESGEISFSFSAFDSALLIQDAVIYQFDRESLSWEPLQTFFDLDTQTLTCELEFSGSVLVGLGSGVL